MIFIARKNLIQSILDSNVNFYKGPSCPVGAEHQLKKSDAAQIPMVPRPRISDVVSQKIAKFTINLLVEMLSRVGNPERLAVG